jgi:hypothetical protein
MTHTATQPYVEVLVGLVVLVVLVALVRAISMANTIEVNLGFVKLTLHRSRRSRRRRE